MANHIRYGNAPPPPPPPFQINQKRPSNRRLERFAYNIVHRILTACDMKHIRLTPPQCLGWVIITALLVVGLCYAFAVYNGWVSNPLKGMEAKAAPTSHLQYFFF
jgi:hypothetical protein